ncbi:hypothetical protein CANARDRAFT_24532 [[Candida] arabinofermentans NRRL YB-2248]|uniref:J domain-containing protein n=1 Tax=[Candida] arabinofermentans NRRL YB-2248 TaxID=983967 RepID=A0A1E4SWG7_9ASCO|nr:hypothetical protein CANARDRAFT_24532 [[Candida] arabinofermentans NRRL YB-2248]
MRSAFETGILAQKVGSRLSGYSTCHGSWIKGTRLFSSSLEVRHDNHYKNLDLSSSSVSQKQIKNSFKKLSLKYHPDILKSQNLSQDELDSKNARYLSIKRSYEILMDPKQRIQYDGTIKNKSGASSTVRANTIHYTRPSHLNRSAPPFSPMFNAKRYNYPQQQESDEVPHFDFQKHLQRNIRNEKRMKERKINYSNLLNHDLINRNVNGNIRKDVYHAQPSTQYNGTNQQRFYASSSGIHETSSISRSVAIAIVGSLIVFYSLSRNFTPSSVSQPAASATPTTVSHPAKKAKQPSSTNHSKSTSQAAGASSLNDYSSQLISIAVNGSSSTN